jgi:cytochrome c-type biogenesis protein CcmE
MAGTSSIVKIVVSVVVVGGAGAGLLASTAGGFEYYKHVDEVAGSRATWQKKQLQLHGFVVPGSIQRRMGQKLVEYRFQEVNCGQTVDVYYAGTVPDTFKDGAEVVVRGSFDGDAFHGAEVMAKCPSKYQMAAGATPMCSRGQAN